MMYAYIPTCGIRCCTSDEPRATRFTWERSTLGIGLSRMVQADDTPEAISEGASPYVVGHLAQLAIGNGRAWHSNEPNELLKVVNS
jgi:hypothetical protein